jgi:hypothetical protein
MRCAIDAKDENKEVCTVLNLFHKHLSISVPLFYVYLLILFRNLFANLFRWPREWS